MTWIQTRSGRIFSYDRIHDNEVDFNDVAYSLANICRFNGHTLRFYSVLEHTVRMVGMPAHLGIDLSPEESRLLRGMILLHDAHEAYIGDLVRPLKAHLCKLPGSVEIGSLDRRIARYVRDKLGLEKYDHGESPLWDLCDQCDLVMLAAEGSQLMCRPLDVHRWDIPEGAYAGAVGFNIPLDDAKPSGYWVAQWLHLYTEWMKEIGGI